VSVDVVSTGAVLNPSTAQQGDCHYEKERSNDASLVGIVAASSLAVAAPQEMAVSAEPEVTVSACSGETVVDCSRRVGSQRYFWPWWPWS